LSTNGKNFSEATLFAAYSGLCYWLAFVYEASYLHEFGIPIYLVDLKLVTILYVGVSIAISVWAILSIANLLALNWPDNVHLKEKLTRIFLFLIILFWQFLSFGYRAEDKYLYICFIGYLIIFEIAWPLLIYRKKSVKRKFIEDEKAELATKEKLLINKTYAIFGSQAHRFILIALLSSAFLNTAAKGAAHRQTDFYVFEKDGAEFAVLRFYSTNIISIKIDNIPPVKRPEIKFLQPSELNKTLVTEKTLGSLLFKKRLKAKDENEVEEKKKKSNKVKNENSSKAGPDAA